MEYILYNDRISVNGTVRYVRPQPHSGPSLLSLALPPLLLGDFSCRCADTLDA